MHSPVPAPAWALLQVWCDVRQPVSGPRPSAFPPGRPARPLPSGSSSHRCAASCLWRGSGVTGPPRNVIKYASDKIDVCIFMVSTSTQSNAAACERHICMIAEQLWRYFWHYLASFLFRSWLLYSISTLPKTFCNLQGHTAFPPGIYYHNDFIELYLKPLHCTTQPCNAVKVIPHLNTWTRLFSLSAKLAVSFDLLHLFVC